MIKISTSKYQSQNDYDVTMQAVSSVLARYDKILEDLPRKNVFLGFDGYVDSLYSLVQSRDSAEKWERMASMSTFGARVSDTAGSSCNIERVLKKSLAGGFGPNTGRAVSHLGASVGLCGALGVPNIHPLFLEYPNNVTLYSITNPGTTAAYEFDDGKVMTTDFGNINGITWDLIMKRVGRDKFIDIIEKSDAIGQGHWALVPNMNDFWQHLIDDVFPNINNCKEKLFLVDAADMKKRPNSDVNDMIKKLQKLDESMPAALTMNDKETADISRVLTSEDSAFEKGRITKIKSKEDYVDFGERLNEVIGLSYVITHDPHFATITTKEKHCWLAEGYTSTPRFTTAAGDHFNGGTMMGLVCGLKPEEALIIGNSLTAIFVRTGVSVGLPEIRRFLENYENYVKDDISDFSL